MKNRFWSVAMLTGFSALLGSALLLAQMPGPRLTAEVPFDFQVQDRVLPAGNYEIQKMNSSGLIQLRSHDSREGVLLLAPASKSGKYGEPMLVFNGYNGRYFLSQIWFDNENAGHVVGKGHQEKALNASNKGPAVLAYVHLR